MIHIAMGRKVRAMMQKMDQLCDGLTWNTYLFYVYKGARVQETDGVYLGNGNLVTAGRAPPICMRLCKYAAHGNNADRYLT